ncbi:hypothetical protein M2360_004438 [Rhizobium sp. SG_E_25_P2]|uniref:hypothetical protein n=1 Tax=Rhizobium sp. SG_E_25_P2 TaxID=2879942 RepID=UPI0024758DDC|nr:hypothetical protein [Rhizobium sp. SG_E_25_P2]MDH6269018.1 hypothetical protein [Rhizobium sp. SG_E_25_P2]
MLIAALHVSSGHLITLGRDTKIFLLTFRVRASLMAMKKQISGNADTGQFLVTGSKLTSERGEKISAVEGLKLSPRMEAILRDTKGRSGDERRAAIKAQFSRKTAAL